MFDGESRHLLVSEQDSQNACSQNLHNRICTHRGLALSTSFVLQSMENSSFTFLTLSQGRHRHHTLLRLPSVAHTTHNLTSQSYVIPQSRGPDPPHYHHHCHPKKGQQRQGLHPEHALATSLLRYVLLLLEILELLARIVQW